MGLTNVVGVLSRYFVIGFFLPAFFVLVALSQVVGDALLPASIEHGSNAEQLGILGATALLIALLLSATHRLVLGLYQGYFLLGPLRGALTRRQKRRFDEALRRVGEKATDEGGQFDARWALDQRFPHDNPQLILPTAFGNVVRAFERHSWLRWHLNIVGVRSHIEYLLSPAEAQRLDDARANVALFLNGSLLSVLAGLIIIADQVIRGNTRWYAGFVVCLAPFLLSSLAYTGAVHAAMDWGSAVRASVDLHRRELYTILGLRSPRNFTDERWIAWRVNATLLVGERLPDDLAANQATPGAAPADEED